MQVIHFAYVCLCVQACAPISSHLYGGMYIRQPEDELAAISNCVMQNNGFINRAFQHKLQFVKAKACVYETLPLVSLLLRQLYTIKARI